MTDFLTDPAHAPFRAAQAIAVAYGTSWVTVTAVPAGEVVWRGDKAAVVHTPENRLVYVSIGTRVIEAKMPGVVATAQRLRALRG